MAEDSTYPQGRFRRDQKAYRQNPNDGGVDRRSADLEAHDKLDIIAEALGTGGESKNYPGDASSVATGVQISLSNYTAPAGKTSYLQLVEVSGSNIALYLVLINGIRQATKRTHFGGSLNEQFDFEVYGSKGLKLSPGDIVDVQMRHDRPYTGDFESRIQVFEE